MSLLVARAFALLWFPAASSAGTLRCPPDDDGSTTCVTNIRRSDGFRGAW